MSYLYDGREGQGGHVFHFVCEQGLVFLCMADEGFGRHVPFAFLDAVIRLWSSRYGDRGGSAVAYGMNDDFSAILQQQMDYHSSRSAADQINRVQGEIDEVRSIMVENIERVLERGEKLELLVDKTENLNHQAFRFKKQSRALRNMMWWKNVKIVLFALVVAIAGLILSMIICGIDFSKCAPPPRRHRHHHRHCRHRRRCCHRSCRHPEGPYRTFARHTPMQSVQEIAMLGSSMRAERRMAGMPPHTHNASPLRQCLMPVPCPCLWFHVHAFDVCGQRFGRPGSGLSRHHPLPNIVSE